MNVPMMRFWRGRAHDLGRMTLGDLTRTYFLYPGIAVYLFLAAVSFAVAGFTYTGAWPLVIAAIAASVVYPVAWYAIHRFIMHGRWIYRMPGMAAFWKRIHFDHHQDPQDLRVLFGAVHHEIVTVAVVTLPVGWLIGGAPAAATAMGVALLTTCLYEFVHCVQHLNHLPKWKWLQDMKRAHVAHHYHSEKGNYGIVDFFWDRVFGTYYASAADEPRSPTVFNLGYTREEAEKYPKVLELSGGVLRDDGPRGLSQAAVRKRASACASTTGQAA